MAKKKEKTLEEKLQEALVPENQWPYMLPENWCWTRLKYISKKISDGSHNPPKNSGSGIPLLSAANVYDFSIDMDSANRWILEAEWVDENKRTCLEKGDVLLTIVATIGRVAIVENEKFALQRSVAVIKPNQVLSKYLMYFLASPYIQAFMHNNAKGTAQKGFYLKSLEQLYIALPSLPEQKRIVHRIESLFAKLDEAKEKIQQVLDGAEMRKAAILHKAFTGELTKTWRKENTAIFGNSSLGIDEELISDNLKKLPDNWCWCKIGDFLELKAGKNIKAENISIEKNDNNKYACYGGNGIRGYVDSFNVEGTHIIIGRQGALCGNINIAENKFYATEHAVVVYPRYDTDISWLSENLRFLNLNQYSRSAAQPGLAVKNINNVLMPVAPYAEQVEMGRLISQMLNVWKQKEIICNKVLNKIDIMKKSILAKAFRGELGTNNPTEDSALNLLKEVLQDKF